MCFGAQANRCPIPVIMLCFAEGLAWGALSAALMLGLRLGWAWLDC